jgi:flagellar hook-length control protein FliK
LTLAGRALESAPTPARSPENPVATPAQAPGQAPAGITQASAAALPSAALKGAALPAQRLRNGPGPLTAGAGDGVRALAAAADRARLAASATSGVAEAEAAQRVAGGDTSAASSAAQAASWMQALEAAVLQAGTESPHGVAPDATASPGLAPVAGESSTRTDASAPESGTLPRIDAAPDSPQFPGMLGARVAAMVRDGVEQARIALNPQELGPVSVQIEMAGTQVRVDLAAEVEATRVALEQALPALAGSLREAGFTLAGGGVFQQARDGGSGDLPSGGSRQGGGRPTARADSTEPGPAPRAPRPQGLVDLYA